MSKLYRSRTDRKITGLCGGLAETLNVDANLLRLVLVVTAFFSGGVVIPLYFLATLVIPSEPYHGGPYGPDYSFGGGRGCGHRRGEWEDWKSWKHGWKEWKHAEKHYRRAQRHGWAPHEHRDEYEGEYTHAGPNARPEQTSGSNLDDMMKDIEKKAMRKEIEELREKVASYEKNQNTKGDV
ncbi:PspC domain-containing protein [Paenibacillus filicis]|uniref:PspC domain-containing protein n=1 Tax=Paenibacillus gyeongsangnamensis TaxID=3388067 RepID=A0ABT4QA02_9BACL|nr:PspC domain-containing protein [Paenibacillus filicis]MCZ8513644.1 PspC domain-containing protein [Paenibacillus filicis]